MDHIKPALIATKNFVARHKTTTAVVVTSTAWMMINRAAMSQHNEFLEEKGLLEEFYNPEAVA